MLEIYLFHRLYTDIPLHPFFEISVVAWAHTLLIIFFLREDDWYTQFCSILFYSYFFPWCNRSGRITVFGYNYKVAPSFFKELESRLELYLVEECPCLHWNSIKKTTAIMFKIRSCDYNSTNYMHTWTESSVAKHKGMLWWKSG